MRLSLSLMILAVILSLQSFQVSAQQTPLPTRMLQARTVFIDNQSGFDRARDEFVDELGKWQRVRIVYNSYDADLVAVLAADRVQMTTQLTFSDGKSGESVWTNSLPWSDQGAMRDLMRDLKQRIDNQERNLLR